MKNTCAIFITDGRKVIICHPTNARKYSSWSLPKGILEENETQSQSAIRETYEEINYKITENNLHKIGDYNYHKDKFYTLFSYKVDNLPDEMELKCKSYIENTSIPEIDEIKIVNFDKLKLYLNPKQFNIINQFLKSYKPL